MTVVRGKHAAPKKSSFWSELPILLGASILVAFLVRMFIVQTYWVPSGSMIPTLQLGDRVIVNKLVYHFNSPDRGEVVVFNSPVAWRSTPDEKVFVKRLIGLPGDHVVCCDAHGRLEINGKPLAESYLNFTEGPSMPAAPQPFNITVPSGRIWVMGDNRYDSGDSAANWQRTNDIHEATVAESAVIGRAFLLFWPFNHWNWLTIPSSFDSIPSG